MKIDFKIRPDIDTTKDYLLLLTIDIVITEELLIPSHWELPVGVDYHSNVQESEGGS